MRYFLLEQPHVLHQFLNKSTNLKTHGSGALKSHQPKWPSISSGPNDANDRPISCAILRGWQGPGGWVLWLVGWTACAGFMQDFAGENGSTCDMGGGRIFVTPNDVEVKVVSPVFFFPAHFGLLHFSLVHKMLGGQPVGDAWNLFEEQKRKDKFHGWSLWAPVIFVISWCACSLSTPVSSTLDQSCMCDRYIPNSFRRIPLVWMDIVCRSFWSFRSLHLLSRVRGPSWSTRAICCLASQSHFFLVVLPTKIESWSLPKCWKMWNRNNRCNVATLCAACCF